MNYKSLGFVQKILWQANDLYFDFDFDFAGTLLILKLKYFTIAGKRTFQWLFVCCYFTYIIV